MHPKLIFLTCWILHSFHCAAADLVLFYTWMLLVLIVFLDILDLGLCSAQRPKTCDLYIFLWSFSSKNWRVTELDFQMSEHFTVWAACCAEFLAFYDNQLSFLDISRNFLGMMAVKDVRERTHQMCFYNMTNESFPFFVSPLGLNEGMSCILITIWFFRMCRLLLFLSIIELLLLPWDLKPE